MVLEREEWENLKREGRLKRERDRKPYYQALRQEKVATAQLTNHPAWNWFLRILAAQRDQAESVLREMETNQRQSGDFSPSGLAFAQASRMAWAERIRTLNEVMELPSQIADDSDRAEKILEELKRAELQENRPESAAS